MALKLRKRHTDEVPAEVSAAGIAPDALGDEHPPRSRRRVLVRVGVAALAVLIVVGVPVLLSLLPGFYARYPDVATPYDAWTVSSHAEIKCYECHTKPTVIARTVGGARTVGDFVGSIGAKAGRPATLAEPTNDACLNCHSDLRTVSPKGDLQIPHKAHVEILKMECVRCHDRHMVHVPGPEGENSPPMEGCLVCHDGDTADDTCTACHTEKAAPETHQASDWVIAHATHGDDPECAECHAWVDNWCVDCHSRRPRSHGDDWRATHRDAIVKRRSCEACHEGGFCIDCHGEVPQANLNPDLTLVK